MPTERLHNLAYNDMGGIDLIISHLSRIRIWDKLKDKLGVRHPRAEYSYEDVIQTWIMNVLCGSKRLEHCYFNREKLLAHPKFKKGMSPDTVSRVFRKLAVENKYYELKDYKHRAKFASEEKMPNHELNNNEKLNELILDTAIELGLLKKHSSYELDIDATLVNSKISDSRYHFKHDYGYCPIVVVLGGIPIYMESRNGNSGASFRLKHVLENVIDLIESRGLKIKLVRSDAAGSQKEIVNYLHEKNLKYIIRAFAGDKLEYKVDGILDWKDLEMNYGTIKTADSTTTFGKQTVRMISYIRVMRNRKDKHDGIVKTWALYTNDYSLTEKEIITTYNVRGGVEQRFSDLNEMGWNYLPHRELKYNTVYMLITMLAFVFFTYLKIKLSKKINFVKPNMELQTFIRKFIMVFTVWVKDKILFLTRKTEYGVITGFV